MQLLDWILALLPVVLVLGIAVCAKRHMKSVADFLSGSRSAGRYLLAMIQRARPVTIKIVILYDTV